MGLLELFILAVGLSMDAFAVSVCKGACNAEDHLPQDRHRGRVVRRIPGADACGRLSARRSVPRQRSRRSTTGSPSSCSGVIGANMIKEALSGDCDDESGSLDVRTMFLLAVATSIDALAVGITFAFLNVHIIAAVLFIGVTTFVISAFGVRIGNIFGTKYKSKAELAGGIILILLGLKILLEHLGIL